MSTYRYIPILRWKTGERVALSKLSPEGKANVKPLILLGSEQYFDTKSPPKKPPKRVPKKAPPAGPEAFVEQLKKAWDTDGDVFLDASGLLDSGGAHHLDRIAARARDVDLQITPATSLGVADDYQAAVERMVKADGNGIALRIRLADIASAPTWVKAWICSPSDTDLIIDLGNGVRDVAALGIPVLDTFASLHGGATWRSVTVAGGSIPQMLSGFKVGSTFIPRHELLLWRALVAHGLPFRIDFGDYVSVAPDALSFEIEGSFPINAKYTLKERFFVRHGVRPKGEHGIAQNVQFRSHAAAIVGLGAARGKLAHCWGDHEIDRIASGAGTAGSPTTRKTAVYQRGAQ